MGVLKVKTADGFVDAGAALSLIGGGTVDAVLEELTITENGEYTPSAGVDGFSKVIAAIETDGGGGSATELSWKYPNHTGALISNIRGYFPGVSKLTIDMAGAAVVVPQIGYIGLGESTAVIDILNSQNATLPSDLFRQTANVKEINFVNGIYHSGTLNRFLYQFNTSTINPSPNYTGEVTVKGFHLDNITAFNGFFYANGGTTCNIVWEGTLYASVDISTAVNLTAESANRLISCLADYSAGEAHTLTLGATLLAKVTEEKITEATGKGWTLA